MNLNESVWNYKISPVVEEIHAKYVDSFTDQQKSKIKELRNRMSDVLQTGHNNFYLSKWLIAKKWDLNAAENMLREDLKWRTENRIDHLREEYTPPEAYVKYAPHGLMDEAKNGSPFLILNFGNADPFGLFAAGGTREILKFNYYLQEYLQRLQLVNTEKYGRVINNYTAIIDMEKFPYSSFFRKIYFDFLMGLCRTFEDHYPLVVGRLLIVNVSKIFTIFFEFCKPFLREDSRSRIFIYGKDSWKENLLEHVDADIIPVHWGGQRVDKIDGNPYCSSHICIGGIVPKFYYKSTERVTPKTNELHTVKIAKRESLVVDIEVKEEETTLCWSFWTEEYDIGFGINRGINCEMPIKRYQCQMTPERGTLLCQKPGKYSLVFDNSFSMYRKKKLSYEVHIIVPSSTDSIL